MSQEPLPEFELDPETVKLAAKYEREWAARLRDIAVEEMSATARWQQASLVVINGGAAVATLATTLPGTTKAAACAAFVAGILLALLVGTVTAMANRRALPLAVDMMAYWLGVEDDGEQVKEIEAKHKAEAKEIGRQGRYATLIGWLSALAFVAGCTVVGIAISRAPSMETESNPPAMERSRTATRTGADCDPQNIERMSYSCS